MRITSLTLVNYRCFEEQRFELHEGFNFFVAPNGGGKTTLLDAMAVAIGCLGLGIDALPSRRISHEDARETLLVMDAEVRAEPHYPVEVRAEGTILAEPLQWSRLMRFRDSEFNVKSSANAIRELGAGIQERVRDGEPLDLPLLAYLGTNRLWRDSKDPTLSTSDRPPSRLDGYIDCLNAGRGFSALREWWLNAELSQLQRKAPKPSLVAVKQAIRHALGHPPDTPGDPLSFPRYDLDYKDILVEIPDLGLRGLRQLSDGYRSTIALFAELAYRAALLNPHMGVDVCEKVDGIVLIDELDLHLHPSWQRRIVDDLRRVFPKVQFVVTTHAPQILTDAKPGELQVLQQIGDNAPVPLQVDIPPGARADQVLTGAWFQLTSTLDDDTLEKVRAHRLLLGQEKRTTSEEERLERLESELRQRLGRYGDTSEERLALEIIAKLSQGREPLTWQALQQTRDETLAQLEALEE